MRGRRVRSLSASLKAGTTTAITRTSLTARHGLRFAAILALLHPTAPGIDASQPA